MALVRIALLAFILASAVLPTADASAASRRMPADSADVWSRWLDFLRESDGPVTISRFEEVMGVELPKRQRLSDDAYRQMARVEWGQGRFFLAAIDWYPKESAYGLAAVQWTSHFFGDNQCLDLEKLTAELSELGWTALAPSTPVGATFRKGYAEMVYSRHAGPNFDYCGLSLRPHRFAAERLNRVQLDERLTSSP